MRWYRWSLRADDRPAGGPRPARRALRRPAGAPPRLLRGDDRARTASRIRCTPGAPTSTPASTASARARTRSSSAATASARSATSTRTSSIARAARASCRNAICLHEEDAGLLWKHSDELAGRVEVRRARRFVVNSMVTVGNYDYAFRWYLHLDGSIECEVQLHGIVSTMALAPGEQPAGSTIVDRGLAAPNHQHFFCFRLDLDVDGVGQQRARGGVRGDSDRPRESARQRLPRARDAARARVARRGATATSAPLASGTSSTPRGATGSAARSATGSCRCTASRRCSRSPMRASRRAPASRVTRSGSRATTTPSATRRGATPTATGDRRPTAVERGRSPARRERRRALVHGRHDALRASRGLADHAGRPRRLPARTRRVLRSQPDARRPAAALPATAGVSA